MAPTKKGTKVSTTSKSVVWQEHHILYDPPWVVRIRQTTHYFIHSKLKPYLQKGLTVDEKIALYAEIARLPQITKEEVDAKAKEAKTRKARTRKA